MILQHGKRERNPSIISPYISYFALLFIFIKKRVNRLRIHHEVTVKGTDITFISFDFNRFILGNLSMTFTSLFKITLLAGAIATSLTACGGGGGGTTSTPTPSTSLSGSAFKGPIDQAIIEVLDGSGNVLATGSSSAGVFTLTNAPTINSGDVVFIRTRSGSYTDETTNTTVNAGTTDGLRTAFTGAEFNTMVSNGTFAALTPETTIFARLVERRLARGETLTAAMANATTLINEQLIGDNGPLGANENDKLLREGNLTTALPANTQESLARNRAISFTIDLRNQGLRPDQMFELISTMEDDIDDGTLDGERLVNGTSTPITIDTADADGSNPRTVGFSGGNRQDEITQARSELVQNTLDRLSSGDLTDAERADLIERLRIGGFDITPFTETDTQAMEADALTTARLASSTLPAFQRLSVMADEDGDATDNNATYSFTPTANVNVTVKGYNDSTSQEVSWTTPMLRYNNQQLPPVIKEKRGRVMTLNLNNQLSEETTIHWHGFKIPGDQDGNPDKPVAAGTSMTYSFTMDQQAAPMWFHPHPDMKTGSQVYKGLAGLFLLSDNITDGLEANNQLPTGDNDIPVIIQDRQFDGAITDATRNLVYTDRSAGILGDTVLVNGVQLPKLEVPRHKVRLRLFNLSNARTYKFALSNGGSFKQIATDGGLLAAPIDVTSVTLGSAERASIVIDFSTFADGDKVMLVSQGFARDQMEFGGMMGGMMLGGGMGGMGGGLFNGALLDIMRFDVTENNVADPVTALYTSLSAEDTNSDVNTRITEDGANTIELTMTLDRTASMNSGTGPVFVFNNQIFDLNRIDQFVQKNAKQIVSIRNASPMAHPFHIHALQWQILDRNGVAATGADLGWVDTILIQPGETVRIIGQFEPVNTGDYMFHCHILEHEDAGMMGFFRVLNEGEAIPTTPIVRDPNFVAP